jgi:hypothetical protein
MSGDHNMNQMEKEWMNKIEENKIRSRAIEGVGVQPEEAWKSQIERQCIEMQATIDLLKATTETLRKRLLPVMADAPMRTSTNELSPVVSPLGLSINQHRQQVGGVIDELAHIIESLEI